MSRPTEQCAARSATKHDSAKQNTFDQDEMMKKCQVTRFFTTQKEKLWRCMKRVERVLDRQSGLIVLWETNCGAVLQNSSSPGCSGNGNSVVEPCMPGGKL